VWFDLSLAGVVLLLALLGYFQGAFRQIFSMAGLILAVLFGGRLAALALGLLELEPVSPMMRTIAGFIAGTFLYISCRFIIYALDRTLLRDNELVRRGNRQFGAFIGGLKGLVVAGVLGFLLAMAVREGVPWVRAREVFYKESLGLRVVRDSGLLVEFDHRGVLRKLQRLIEQRSSQGVKPEVTELRKVLSPETMTRLLSPEVLSGSAELPLDEQALIEDLYRDPAIRELILQQASGGKP